MDIDKRSGALHQKHKGKIKVKSKSLIRDQDDLSLIYTPGVAAVCREIIAFPEKIYDLTIKKNTIAIVTDGSAVLGLGDIGPQAALPAMEGKAVLFKEFAGINAFPICLNTQKTVEIISIVKNILPVFAGINLEDISAPRCFEIEQSLRDIGVPVYQDDQHGTAIVLLAAIINSAILSGKNLKDLKVVINGDDAAATAIAGLLFCGDEKAEVFQPIKDIIICDSRGIVSSLREDIQLLTDNHPKKKLTKISNEKDIQGDLADALIGADVFIGVSKGSVLTEKMIKSMAVKPVIFILADSDTETDPVAFKKAGAFIVATGRGDYPNQINNSLVFPGVFRGALDACALKITNQMKIAAAAAFAGSVEHLNVDNILPSVLEKKSAWKIAQAVKQAYLNNLKSASVTN